MNESTGESIRVRGLVQGVGFRPTVWRLAGELGLTGEVLNDGEGVLIRAWGQQTQLDALCQRLRSEAPPLARIDAIERYPNTLPPDHEDFRISRSQESLVQTGIVPEAATCPQCLSEVFDPADRRYQYAFANCTHCGPRLSIILAIPYDRANTSMAMFELCAACQLEYENPADRRFHAQPIACPVCGPQIWLKDAQGQGLEGDAIAQANAWLRAGRILAIKGIGGFHLACDAANEAAVAELRRRKRRYAKPFAMMARDSQIIRHYCMLSKAEEALLRSPAAPIVLLDTNGSERLAPSVARAQTTLGFMLPYSPLHHLLLAEWDSPLVMTSGNRSEQPQCTDNQQAREQLNDLADGWLLHNRDIVNRLDDSVVRIINHKPRVLRRARGYVPSPLPLPPGFADAPELTALGGELKNAFCLLRGGQAIMSQHIGDLEDARTLADYKRTLNLYAELFRHKPQARAVDLHPEYLSSKLGRQLCSDDGLPLVEVQHHHAHIAACLAENLWPCEGGAVLGVALDGVGYGDDGTLWGGEWLRADYQQYQRLARIKPVPLLGGTQAILQPWRVAYAHLAALGWQEIAQEFAALDGIRHLKTKPLKTLDAMRTRGFNSPLSSACGRLFDAAAALIGVCRENISYEGQAAIELEALADGDSAVYPCEFVESQGVLELDPALIWYGILSDLLTGETCSTIAARFHNSVAAAVIELCSHLAARHNFDIVALSGGVFQNARLSAAVEAGLQKRGVQVLSHQRVPANDGGLALGQAIIAAAQWVHS